MFRIKTMNKISPLGLAQLNSALFETGDSFTGEDAILVRSADLHNYEFPAELKAIARAGAGVNNIPLDRAANAGIVVFYAPGANANAVKELVICALLLASRNVSGGIEWVRSQAAAGADVAAIVEKGKAAYVGPEIMGKTLAVVGLGAVGVLVANAAAALGMNVVGYDPFLSIETALRLDTSVRVVKDLDDLYRDADYISLHLPMNKTTANSFNNEAFAQMKDGVRIVNLARGELVNTGALLTALTAGKVACYVTDFPTSDLAKARNVIPIPHLGASTPESEDNCAMMAAREVQDYLLSGNIVNAVNLPNLSMDWHTGTRVCILSKGTEDLAGTFTTILTMPAPGVAAMATKSLGEFSYTILDISGAVEDEQIQKLEAIPGVIRVRVLTR